MKRLTSTPVAVVADLSALVDRVGEGADGIAKIATPAAVQELVGHNPDRPVYADDTNAVVADCTHDPCTMAPMSIVIFDILTI